MAEAQEVASYILGEEGCLTDDEFMAKYKHAASPHFDPKKHLKKMGLANQTTMYKKETQAIGRLFEKASTQPHPNPNPNPNPDPNPDPDPDPNP